MLSTKPKKNWFVYLLICSDQTIYCGITNDLPNRYKAHNDGRGAKYTRARRPCLLCWCHEADSKSHASKIEYKIKQLPRKDKQRLIDGEELGNVLKCLKI